MKHKPNCASLQGPDATQVALPYSIPDCDCGADHPFAHFVQVVLTPDEASVLRAIKTYFGHHDRTPFEHMAYGLLDKLCTAIRVSGLEGLVPPQEDRTTVSPEHAAAKGLSVGDRVMDTLINQSATVTKVIPSAIMPSWIVAYLITYDVPPPMEYNMGSVDSMQFSRWIRPL